MSTKKQSSGFITYVKRHRQVRSWNLAELARRAGLSQPEVSRLESGVRMPTMRHVKGLAEAFSGAPTGQVGEPRRYEDWLAMLVDYAERSRQDTYASRKDAVQETATGA